MGTHSLIFKAGTLPSAWETTFHSEVGDPWPGAQGTAGGQGSLGSLPGLRDSWWHPSPNRGTEVAPQCF